MAWYTDEQYAMIQDSREKKSIAASAFKQRSHCGKGGSVKFPSDYMSRKELNAMNGECKSYRMNDPISWSEFVEWPNEHKVSYIKRIREKFGASDKQIAEMFDVACNLFLMYVREIGLEAKPDCDDGWKQQKFYAWRAGARTELVEENNESTAELEEPKTYERSLMSWTDFKLMTDEKKIEYIKWIRETFNANDSAIAKAMNVNRPAYAKLIARLGIGVGKGSGHSKWDEDSFMKWCEMKIEETATEELVGKTLEVATEVVIPCAGPLVTVDEAFQKHVENIEAAEKSFEKPQEAVESENVKPEEIREDAVEAALMAIKHAAAEVENELKSECSNETRRAVPVDGDMNFRGNADDILRTISMLLAGSNVSLSVSWRIMEDC